MAPEEFEAGSLIDERTNVFVMGRAASVLLGDGTLESATFRGSMSMYEVMLRACASDRSQRFGSLEEFYDAWRRAGAD
jgi:serine/threonine-protein kinase